MTLATSNTEGLAPAIWFDLERYITKGGVLYHLETHWPVLVVETITECLSCFLCSYCSVHLVPVFLLMFSPSFFSNAIQQAD